MNNKKKLEFYRKFISFVMPLFSCLLIIEGVFLASYNIFAGLLIITIGIGLIFEYYFLKKYINHKMLENEEIDNKNI